MLLITGATGTVGGHVLTSLSRQHTSLRALVRSTERADVLRGLDCDVAVGSYEDAASLHRAMAGVDRVFLLSPPSERMAEQEQAVIDAASAANSEVAIVKIGAAGLDPSTRLGGQHAAVAESLAASGLPYTVLEPTSFLQNLLAFVAQISETDSFAAAGGDSRVAYVDARDVAEVAAHVLTSDGHAGATYTVSGPAALTYADIAEQISAVVGRTVSYRELPPDEARRSMVAAGLSTWLADALAELADAHRAGLAAEPTGEVEKATGRPALSLDTFLADHAAAFRR